MTSAKTRRRRSDVTRLVALLGGSGVLHFARPTVFQGIVPESLPGTSLTWVRVSGAAELATAALVALPATRRAGGALAALLFVAVFPANVKMARDALANPRASRLRKAVAVGRLPIQLPLVARALRIRSAA